MMPKDLDYYMQLRYRIELIPEEAGSWGAFCPELLGCAGAGATISEALAMLEDAKQGWFASRLAGGHPIPEPQHSTFVA
jgi:predicted RNase H-like HicB family nuclease